MSFAVCFVRDWTVFSLMHSDYTEGYHRLMEWMSKSFEQKEVLRVVKALAAFRPSLIALQ